MAQSGTNAVSVLRRHLIGFATRRINGSEIDALLAACWEDFEGSDDGGMRSFKLRGRLEEVEWSSPVLTFTIERHGGTVHGSSRAELQAWSLDLDLLTAENETRRYRQLRPNAPRLDTASLADTVFALIDQRSEDPRLNWRPNGTVAVNIGIVIPDAGSPRQTLTARRKRFRAALDQGIVDAGGDILGTNRYQPPPR